MRRRTLALALIAAATMLGCQSHLIRRGPVTASESRQALSEIAESPTLSALVEQTCRETIAAHPEADLAPDRIWAAVLDVTSPSLPQIGHWRGDEQVYPASVIKTVFLVHTYQQALDGELRLGWRTRRLLREMIRVSSNVATQDIVDLLSETTDGPRIDEPAAYASWCERRNATNQYMRTLGFTRMNANQKTWDELPDANSRELQFLGADHAMGFANGNRLTAVEIAQLMWLIDQDRVVSEGACAQMRDLLERDDRWWRHGDDRIRIGTAVPPDANVWAKAGSTGRWFHDAATVILRDGRHLILAVFTDMPSREGLDREAVLATWTRILLDAMN